MRNRGVEIFLLPEPRIAPKKSELPEAAADEGKTSVAPLEEAAGHADLQFLAAARGMPGSSMPTTLENAHWQAVKAATSVHRRAAGMREICRCVSLTAHLVASGWSMPDALSTAWLQAGFPPCPPCAHHFWSLCLNNCSA